MHVVATAGHVDHGKSTLVQALTDTDPDRLDEEHRRGLTIELGYAWTELPDVGEVAFVDVPGHERFLTTALSGVGPVLVAMLVVAADDPWMPQAEEHLRILDLLGVRHGLVVVSRTDLADPAPTIADVRRRLAGTGLAGAPVLAVSARTGDGLADLRATLSRVLRSAPYADPGADVRLWVDRCFHVRGTGTVVTGTLPAGTITAGDVLTDAAGDKVRVRGLQALGRPRDSVSGPARVALDLGGRAPDSLGRGTALLTPEAFEPTTVVEVALDAPADGSTRLPRQLQVHIGSTHVDAHVRPLSASYARLMLSAPLPLRVGDRAVLRDPGNRALWGACVLDPAPPPLRRRGAAVTRGGALDGLDGSLAADLELRGPARRSFLRRIGLEGPLPPDAVEVGDWLVPEATRLCAALVDLVPSGTTLPLVEATRTLALSDPAITEALVAPPLEYVAGRIRRVDDSLSTRAVEALEWLRSHLAARPFAAPTADELRDAGLDAALVAELHREDHLLRLAPGVVLLPGALEAAVTTLAGLPQPFTTSQARKALDTSRRVVLPLLGRLDATGRTVRLPDDTRRVVSASEPGS